ncbi:hypothetical protein PAERUG_E15_London_28_01_14_04300 [Pseudomonas aeruginosa]|nr:hypothetical protein PAERUG_E15_London_28_01_14_04300 [Pseudomonas aeruginosa]
MEVCRGCPGRPGQTQVAGLAAGKLDLADVDAFAVEGQAGDLSVPPGLPMLEVVAGFHGEALEALLRAAPVQPQALQGKSHRARVDQPAAQSLGSRPGVFRQHLDYGAAGVALHPQVRLRRVGGGRASQREQPHLGLMRRAGLALAAGHQGVGQGLAFGIEDPQVAQVGMGSRQLHAHRDAQAIPGTFALQRQRHLAAETFGRLLRRQRQGQAGAQQEQAGGSERKGARHGCSASDATSARRGGKGEK